MEKNQLSAIIADDESLARNVIRKWLSAFPRIKILGECENGLLALNKIEELKPDIVFLDIQMPDLDGLSLLKELKQLPLVIFTTAFNQYAVNAFEANAVDYLLKPFTEERFAQAVNKALSQKGSQLMLEKKISSIQTAIDQMLNHDANHLSRILIKEKSGYSFINATDITWFEADSDYVKIHCATKVYLKNISLNALESKLDPKQFIRIHRSTIVNISFIKSMKPHFNGEYHLQLTNGEELKLSRSYKDGFKRIIGESI